MRKAGVIAGCIIILCLVSISIGIYSLILKPAKSHLPSGKIDLLPLEGIAVVYIYGPIQISDERELFFVRGADQVVRRLAKIKKDPRIKGVVLRINSPGGTVGAVQEIYKAVKDLRSSGKPVVVSMGDIAASGAYYVACGADKIVANPGTLIGSIGVIMSIPNVKGFLGKFGLRFEIIKSGEYKDIGSIFKDMTSSERQLLEGVVGSAYDQFYRALFESRGKIIPQERLRRLADGRIFTGEQAKEVGLVDVLGTFGDSIKLAGRLAGIKGEPLVIGEETFPFERIFGLIEDRSSRIPLGKLENPESIQLEYRYLPGLMLD